MKKHVWIAMLFLLVLCTFSGCSKKPTDSANEGTKDPITSNQKENTLTFKESLASYDAYAGYFEDALADVTITCISGTANCYQVDGDTITFQTIAEDSVYRISGQFQGNIVIDVGDDCEFELELQDFSLVSVSQNPITILSADEAVLTAMEDSSNYIYDVRAAIDENDESVHSGAIYSKSDLKVCGDGSLTVISEHNNGIHTKDDLKIKDLTLFVACMDNALKGNDSVTVKKAQTTLIAAQGDGIKTKNSDISKKGKQRGSITISGGTHFIYAACDGIDAAYDVIIDTDTTKLNIYTDKYSDYSREITAVSEEQYYIRYTSKSFRFSVKYYNSDNDYLWVNPEYHSCTPGKRCTYFYYSFPKMREYSQMQFFMYSLDTPQGQEENYLLASEYMPLSTEYDTFALTTQGSTTRYEWTNYSTSFVNEGMGWMGGMNDGNTEKGDHSTKGIKADNEISILAGEIFIQSYDDAIHANNDNELENGALPCGDVTVSGGNLTLYTNDDGIHADGTVTILDGMITITNSYEGLEGDNVRISGGNISISAKDDGINGTATSGTAIELSGGTIYINCTGDGIDSNSRTAYQGIVFSGSNAVIIADSFNNSAIDTEQGYTYTKGSVLAIMPSRGMTQEVSHCQNFSAVATKQSLTLNANDALTVYVDGELITTVKMKDSIQAMAVYLGSPSASLEITDTITETLDENGVFWNK